MNAEKLEDALYFDNRFAHELPADHVDDNYVRQVEAACHGGHQFDNWAGQLGDGRAINLGEVVNGQGERWVLQLKGVPAIFSHGRWPAVLLFGARISLAARLCCRRATTRALSLVTTGKDVRDMFYDGHPKQTRRRRLRIAPSFYSPDRFNSLQRGANRRTAACRLRSHRFSPLGHPSEKCICAGEEIVQHTALLVAHWIAWAWHGVMNTDNMSILGLTIDYGPYGWLENYDPGWTPNTTDASGRRYRYNYQSPIAHWNLAQLGQALLPLY